MYKIRKDHPVTQLESLGDVGLRVFLGCNDQSVIPIGATAIREGRGGAQAPTAGGTAQILGDSDGLQTVTFTAAPLAVDQLALDIATGRRNAGTIGILEGAVFRIEEGEDHPVQADIQATDRMILGIVVAQVDQLLPILGSTVGILQRSELLGELDDLGAELLHCGLQDLLVIAVVIDLLHQVLTVASQPNTAYRLSSAAECIDGDHYDLIGSEELGGSTAHMLLHLGRSHSPGTLGGAHVQHIEHRGGVAEGDELTDHRITDAGVFLFQALKLAGSVLTSAVGFFVHTFSIPFTLYFTLGK